MTHDATILLPVSRFNLVATCCIFVAMRQELLAATMVERMMMSTCQAKHKFTVSTIIQCRVQIAFCDSCDTLALLVAMAVLTLCG
jgi:hypothetical protein